MVSAISTSRAGHSNRSHESEKCFRHITIGGANIVAPMTCQYRCATLCTLFSSAAAELSSPVYMGSHTQGPYRGDAGSAAHAFSSLVGSPGPNTCHACRPWRKAGTALCTCKPFTCFEPAPIPCLQDAVDERCRLGFKAYRCPPYKQAD